MRTTEMNGGTNLNGTQQSYLYPQSYPFSSTYDEICTYTNTSSFSVSRDHNKCCLLESLCKAFRNNTLNLNSPLHKLNQAEFCKVMNMLAYYKSSLPDTESVEWCIERGESSNSFMPLAEAVKGTLVCYIQSKRHKVLGKLVVNNAERKLVVPKISVDGNSNLQLLKTMGQLTNASIKDRYVVPTNHTKLCDIENTKATRLQIFGVVTAINKLPTRTKASWHSLICISDPSLIANAENEADDLAPCEFKMHFFFPLLEDHPEIHCGDVVRFTNVKIESHLNRCDGRIFSKTDVTVYCHPDSAVPVQRESFEERATVVRLLSHWWTLNNRFFDCLTPHPIYHLISRYPGVRKFKELSDQLICDLYCQIVNISEDSSDLNFLCVRDGTIFTMEDHRKSATLCPLQQSKNEANDSGRPSFGYMALAIFNNEHWKKLKTLKLRAGDYLFIKEVKVVFLTETTLANLGSCYPFRHPCVLLRPVVEGIKKIPASHHEAYKIRSRLHRLPQELEKMATWKLPQTVAEEEHEDPMLARLNDSEIQVGLLKRLKRF